MTDFRALCAELAAELDHNRRCLLDDASLTHPLADRARAALAEPVAEPPAPPAEGEIDQLVSRLRDYAQGEADNGWHDDAARFRRAAELLERLAAPVPVAEPPAPPADYIDPEHSGTNREKLEVFYSATLSEGGTADEIALRGINAVLARWGQPPAPPSEGEVAELVAWLHGQDGGLGRRAICARIAELLERHAAPVPVPVAERLPQPEDCDADGKCWLWNAPQFLGEAGWWTLNHYAWSEDPTHWLPAHALPLPAPQGGEVEP